MLSTIEENWRSRNSLDWRSVLRRAGKFRRREKEKLRENTHLPSPRCSALISAIDSLGEASAAQASVHSATKVISSFICVKKSRYSIVEHLLCCCQISNNGKLNTLCAYPMD